MLDKMTHRSRGFGFVTFDTEQDLLVCMCAFGKKQYGRPKGGGLAFAGSLLRRRQLAASEARSCDRAAAAPLQQPTPLENQLPCFWMSAVS